MRLSKIDHKLHLTHYQGEPSSPGVSKTKALKLGIITSIRDVGASDGNGRMTKTPEGEEYIEGVPEALYKAIQEQGLPIEIAGIITDDVPTDDLNGYAATPNFSDDWIFPKDLGSANGVPLSQLVQNIGFEFRKINHDPNAKARAKAEFETQVWEAMQAMGADVMLSDHLMLRAHNLLDETRFGVGKALNIHPAITAEGHPLALRGKTPTQEAIDKATNNDLFRTGGTFHVMNRTIDDGPQLACAAPTNVYGSDTPMQLRARNYPTAKIPVVIAGLQYYFETIYPNLAAIQNAGWTVSGEEIRELWYSFKACIIH